LARIALGFACRGTKDSKSRSFADNQQDLIMLADAKLYLDQLVILISSLCLKLARMPTGRDNVHFRGTTEVMGRPSK
jgi:hypothetical protein